MDGTWTIAELAEHAASALAAARPGRQDDGPVRANGRVRDVPNERLVRWYVTVGLVDPPLSRRGRIARYGRRHLLQLVAVKRRQAEGQSLAEIQAELAGATDESLAAVAGVPAPAPTPHEPPAAPGEPAATTGEPAAPEEPAAPARFWAGGPRQPGRVAALAAQRAPVPAIAHGGHAGRGTREPPAGLVRGVRLAPGVTLLLESADHEPGPGDVAGLAAAAGPLLRELASRGLCACAPAAHPEQDAAGAAPDPEVPEERSDLETGSRT